MISDASTHPPEAGPVAPDLTPEQHEAIEHEDGPLLVLAGAGSGKTRVITRRIARLIEKGIDARAILSITFTNKAAGEMKERVGALVPGRTPWVSTFHAFCARLLREDIPRIGYSRGFSIFDEDDALSVVKLAMEEVGALDDERPAAARAAISSWKTRLVGPDEAYREFARDHRRRLLAEVYRVYLRLLREQQALDFDDLLLKALELLRVDHEARSKWNSRFAHLQVDEYQDTNRIQFELLRLLVGPGKNIAVVGDPDQSIYSWRGAEPRNIDDFVETFEGARVIRLTSNFRSRQAILDAASSLIAGAGGIRAGALTGVRGPGELPSLLCTTDEKAEAREIATRVSRARSSGMSLRDIALFYRTNAQSRAFEEVFIQAGIPYTIVGSVAFYHRREIKDVLAYVRAALNPADEVAFRRLVNTPKRGFGAAALAKLVDAARDEGIPLSEAAADERIRASLRGRNAKTLEEVSGLLSRLARVAPASAGETVHLAIEDSGLGDMYEAFDEPDRLENLEELESAAAEFDVSHPGEGVAGFIEHAALVSDIDMWESGVERVTLMTLHAAKGLEFPLVFITGVEEGLLPHMRTIGEGDPGALDEERRLLYVGMTRAQDELTLAVARGRSQGGQSRMRQRSRFLDDIPASRLLVQDLAVDPYAWESQARPGIGMRLPPTRRGERELDPEEETRAVRKALAAYDGCADEDQSLDVGDRVRHPALGEGTIVALKGAGEHARITIDFPGRGRKTIAPGYVRLSKLS
jgi:DNA helicase-2/ATP-dependent DNA helicase PcrA